MPTNIKLYGFSLLRNGNKYDYPYKECFSALTELCQETYLALGDSEDGTEDEIKNFESLKIIPTVWDPSLMGDGGKILSQQTNVALDTLRKDHQEEGDWGIYLQTDELLHEKDFEKIKLDIQKAEESGCDAMRFRYYHFWLNHNQIAISKRWYPQEIRAIKLKSNIQSHGDAQGFKNFEKVYESDVHIFHYGHVRDEEKREAKQELLMKMIRPQEKFKKYKKREEKDFHNTETLPYYGPHPKWMKERLDRFKDFFRMENKNYVKIYDPRGIIDDDLRSRIAADYTEIFEKAPPKDSLSLESTFWHRIGLKKQIPFGMRSSLARPWSEKQRMEFLLWCHGIST